MFLSGQRPDPTNVLIGFASAAIAYAVASWLTRWSNGTAASTQSASIDNVELEPAAHGDALFLRLLAVLVFAATAWAVASYPLGRLWLALSLLLYAALLFRYPMAWLAVIPALLPTLDLAPWTGWIYLSEFDLFVLVTLAVGLWNADQNRRPPQLSGPSALLVTALSLSALVSTAIGLLPLQALDHNAFSSYLSHFNALRVSKGLFEAIALFIVLGLQRQSPDTAIAFRRFLLPGLTVGLLGLIGAILWERMAFAGLFDFASPFRATGTFSSMQIGGPYIEAYLVFVLPLVILWGILSRRWSVVFLVTMAVAGGAYCLLVTFARGGYLGLAVALLVFALGVVFSAVAGGRDGKRFGLRAIWVVPLLLVLIVVALGAAVVTGPYARYRLAKSSTDLRIRLSHWENSLAMIDDSWIARTFGMGVGRYPETYLLKNQRGLIPGNFRYEALDGKTFLRLGAGDSLYIGQIVPVSPRRHYVLSLDARSLHGSATLLVYLCEKHILNARDCQSFALDLKGDKWARHLINLDSADLGSRIGPLPPMPVELSFSNHQPGTIIDLTRVQLLDEYGRNIVANGDFASGANRWFFTTDDYWPWRVENVWLQILFDQGWLGLLAFTMLMVYLCVSLLRRLRGGDVLAVGLLASYTGVLTVGLFGSILDSPRIALLFYFTLLLALRHIGEPRTGGRGAAVG